MIFSWSKKKPFAKIQLPVQFPSVVEPNKSFSIQYTIKNTGQTTGVIWAKLLVNGTQLPNSYWSRRVSVGGVVTKTYTHNGIAADTTIVLQAGY